MLAVRITRNDNEAYENQYSTQAFPLLSGWAVIPESLGSPETLENFPFGKITVEEIDGIPTVTSWTPLPVPEPEEPPEMDTGYSAEDMLRALTGA